MSFRRPVTGMEPFGVVRHPTLSVSVADPDALRQRLRDAIAAG